MWTEEGAQCGQENCWSKKLWSIWSDLLYRLRLERTEKFSVVAQEVFLGLRHTLLLLLRYVHCLSSEALGLLI